MKDCDGPQTKLDSLNQSHPPFSGYLLVYTYVIESLERLDSFLSNNTHIFTLVGLFAALVIYYQTISDEVGYIGDYNSVAFIGFLTLLFLSSIILLKMVVKIWESPDNILSPNNWLLLVFGALYGQLTAVLSGILLQFENQITLYILTIVVVGGSTLGLFLGFVTLQIPFSIASRSPKFERTTAVTLLFIIQAVITELSQYIPAEPNAEQISGLITVQQSIDSFIYFVSTLQIGIVSLGFLITLFLLVPYWIFNHLRNWVSELDL